MLTCVFGEPEVNLEFLPQSLATLIFKFMPLKEPGNHRYALDLMDKSNIILLCHLKEEEKENCSQKPVQQKL